METKRDKLIMRTALVGLLLACVQIGALLVVGDQMDGKPGEYRAMVAYFLVLLVFDVMLWLVKSPTATRIMRRYWLVAAGISVFWIQFGRDIWISENGRAIIAELLLWTCVPFPALLPVSDLISPYDSFWRVGWLVLLLSVFHFLYFYGQTFFRFRNKRVLA